MSALARQDEIGREAQSESVGIDQTNQAQNSLASENSILRRESLDNTEILPPLAQGNSEAPPSASDLTLSEVLFPPVVPSDHRQSENDTKARSVVGHNEAHLLPKALEQQQSVNDQSPSAHRNSEQVQPKVHQVDTHHPEGPSSSSPRTSEPPVHESSDTLIVSKSTLRDSSPEKSKRVSDVLPQLTDEDTQTSTTARIDDLFQRAGLDSDSTNNVEGGLIHPSPRGTAVFTRIEIGTRAAVGPKPSSIVPTIEDEDTDIDDELKGTVPDTTPVHGRPKNNHPPKTTKPIKRNVEALQEDVHTNLKTPAKRRKIHDSESSMESTIQVRPYSSRRKAASSQSSSKENRGLSAMSPETGSATRSQRTAEEQALNGTLYNGPPPCILFSNSKVDEKPQLIKFLNHRGGRKVTAVDDCTMLCVGPGELKKTSKLLLAVASGKDIVRDKWLVDSAKQGRLLDPTPYWAEDPGREDEWGTKLEAAVARGKACVKPFTGRTVHFTPTLKRELGSGFTELKEVALLAGAAAVYAKLPPKGADPDADTLVLASQHGNDASIVRQSGWNCYNKDIISLGVLHGRLDTISGKFVIKPSGSQETKGGKRKKK
ncbi:hypothetical protein MMC16_005860 [Acarospora aff. strigata]|nr:hypothetical protein [Acarospora aff. strigata]